MLTVINSNGAITEVDLDKYNKKELRIGRDGSQCDIVIADPFVSKVHGMIHLERSYPVSYTHLHWVQRQSLRSNSPRPWPLCYSWIGYQQVNGPP